MAKGILERHKIGRATDGSGRFVPREKAVDPEQPARRKHPANVTSFKPGHPGRPGKHDEPRAKRGMDLRDQARIYTTAAVKALGAALKDKRTAVSAAALLLERGWGRPVQAIAGPDGTGPIQVVVATGVVRRGDPRQTTGAPEMIDVTRLDDADELQGEFPSAPVGVERQISAALESIFE